MAPTLTLDASVWIAACRPSEPGYQLSLDLMALIRTKDISLIEPAHLPIEVASALCRTGSNPGVSREYGLSLLELPQITVLPIDDRLIRRAVTLATDCKLRAADALYVAVAVCWGTHLVTLDHEQLKRVPPLVPTLTPESAIKLLF